MPTVAEIAEGFGFEADGDLSIELISASHPSSARSSDLALAMDPKFLPAIAEGAARAAMLAPGTDWRALGLSAAIFAPRARYALSKVTTLFDAPYALPAGAHASAVVAEDAEIDPSAAIGPLTVVGRGARIAAGVRILGQASIGDGAEIGADSLVFPGVRVGRRVRIGDRAILHENAVIGADGFSFVTPERGAVEAARASSAGEVADETRNGAWARIASLGAVVVGEDVEIGAGTTIDRGTVVDTIIGRGTKLDNLVQVGHNVRIGEDCLLCGQSAMAGSARLGDRVVLGGQSGVGDHASIGDDVLLMAASAASGAVKSRSIIGGTPAMPRRELTEILLMMRRLPRLAKDVQALKKHFSSSEPSG